VRHAGQVDGVIALVPDPGGVVLGLLPEAVLVVFGVGGRGQGQGGGRDEGGFAQYRAKSEGFGLAPELGGGFHGCY
ncbi:hypothetical protein, partial [Escherichia coli]|uniref:hypothetical protein n=1 Tax=Escherichia coli TaxID=562 RepID=UPI0039E185AF